MTDRQTDRRTDRIAMAKTLKAVGAFARKNYQSIYAVNHL